MTETPDDILHMPEYEVRACKTTFRLQLPEMMDGFRLTGTSKNQAHLRVKSPSR